MKYIVGFLSVITLVAVIIILLIILAPLSLHSEDFSIPGGDEEKKIGIINLYVSLNSTEISKINFEKIRPEIEKRGYNWTNSSWINNVCYIASQRKPNIIYDAVGISIIWNRTTNTSHIDAFFEPEYPFPEKEIEEKRQYLREKVQEIAEICNLTIDWSEAKWSYSYAD